MYLKGKYLGHMLLDEFLKSFKIEVEDVSISNLSVELDMFDGEFVGQCSPLFRWAGGKSQLLSPLKFYAPKSFDTYYEPFIGAGALLFALMPKKAVINDLNPVLTNLYLNVKNNYPELIQTLNQLSKLPDTESVYLTIRDMFNANLKAGNFTPDMSALFLYLNAKGFNGLYRVNSKGEFNVGYAKDLVKPCIYSPEVFKYVHNYFVNNQVDILQGDFLNCTKTASKGDFVYFDPPYIPVSQTKNFTSNTSTKFDESLQYKLADEFKRLSDLGVKCMLSNSDTPLLRELYKSYTIRELNVTYMINPNSNDLKRTECLVLNY